MPDGNVNTYAIVHCDSNVYSDSCADGDCHHNSHCDADCDGDCRAEIDADAEAASHTRPTPVTLCI